MKNIYRFRDFNVDGWKLINGLKRRAISVEVFLVFKGASLKDIPNRRDFNNLIID